MSTKSAAMHRPPRAQTKSSFMRSRKANVAVVAIRQNTNKNWLGGAVERPSGGPSAPGRRCWRLGRDAPVAFFKLGAHSATLRPEFGGP